MKTLLKILLISIFFPGLTYAGGIGSGGSPPAILLPKNQFTEMTLGILRGEDILIRSEGIDKKFQPTGIDTRNGTITVSSPEDGATVVLQDFEKRFSKKPGVLNSIKKMQSGSSVTEKLPAVTIPKNPDITTVPKDDQVDESISE